MEQNKSYDPIDPNNRQPYTPDTQTDIQNTQPAAPYTQPAVQNIQTETSSAQSESHPARRIISVLFSAVEIILGLRLILKLLTPRTGTRVVKTEYTGPARQNSQHK